MLSLLILSAGSNAANEALDLGAIKHVRHKQDYLAKREKYFIDLLTLALDKSGFKYQLQPVITEPHSEYRGAQYLRRGQFDVHWLNTTERLEKDFIPVRIPLFKGMIGWRLFIIRREDADKFAQIRSIEQLRNYTALQGYSWPDTQILRRNNLKVETATDLFSLSRMLEHKRGDYFPRGITEAWSEIKSYDQTKFAVDTHLVLRYPAAYYFFVHRDNEALGTAIEKGLNIAITDGSFDKVFQPYFEDDIRLTKLHSRALLTLPNPILPAETALEDKRLWFTLNDKERSLGSFEE